MIIAFALGDPLCGIVFLGCMILIRSYCGGYHADSYFKCNCMMIILFSVAYGIGKTLFYFEIAEFHIMSSVLMLGFITIYAFSPVKNKHKDLSEKKAKKCRKRAMETWKKEDIEVRDVTEEWNARWMKKKKYKEVLL